jgi:ABC-2 type transport system permease protein
VLVTASSIKGLYPTQADLDVAAAAGEANAALIALQGPAYGLDTLGGQVVFNFGAFGYSVVALMGVFLVGRHTRADEEAGRTELLRATVVGRDAPATAVLVVAAAAFVVLGALAALSLMSQALPTAGSIAFGLAIAGFGFLFACITAVLAQTTEQARPVYGMAAAVLGVSYVLRAIGDIGSGILTWLSPMGWAMSMRPFADERWWPFLLLFGAAALMIVLTFALAGIRDLGGGLVPGRRGPPHGGRALAGPFGLAFRLQRATVFWWVLGLALTGVAYGAVVTDVDDLIGDNSTFEDMIAQGGGDLTDTFLATSMLTMALIAGGFAISSTLRLRSEETAGHAEAVLATATPRPRWAGSHLGIALGGSFLLVAAAGLGIGITYAIVVADSDQIGRLAGAAIAFAPALWILIGVAVVLFGIFPRASVGAWGALAFCAVIGLFGELFDLPNWIVDLSPFQHVPTMPVEGFNALPIVVMIAIAAVLIGAGVAGFRHRDAGY